ncbi:DUF6297 family protein [Streptomyces sp. DSM 44915]|uniref:DUF6297 family protein n=1 Tax=Streptomyces chisholmiae TaxID=3075540 RepID=A0ABU2JQ01_9ACTN|nr:DUF6297 family protein [Streptomyces sp. DSM 44915]MDT0267050.1 DUF6297 family protein [Streptomyces sp. DSM 44915]
MGQAGPEVLRRLDEFRARGRAARRRRALYVGYCVLLFAAIYGVPYLAALADVAAAGRWRGPTADRVLTALPALAPALVGLALLGTAQLAFWRGPVRLPAATVHWLVPQPVSRAALLLPRLRRSWLVSGVLGALLGTLAGLVTYAVGGGRPWPVLLAGAGGGLAVGLLAVTVGVVTQRYHPWWWGGRRGARQRLVLAVVAGALVAHAGLALAAAGAGGGRLVLWSGPWGWAALPLAAAAGRVPVLDGVLGGVLTLLVTAGALGLARRAAVALPAAVLRQQTRVAHVFTAALYGFDPGVALGALRAPRRMRRATGRRLRAPRARWLLVPWRDALGLLRAPGRTGGGLALWAATLALLSLDHQEAGLLALGTGYLAAAQLVEPARLDGERPERAGQLPWRRGALALRHALLPGALLLATLPVAAALGAPAGRLVLAGAWAPALVGAALVSAHRGTMPPATLLGVETPLGDTGPVQALFWLARAPLVTLPALAAGQLAAGSPPFAASWALAVGGAALAWARRTAGRDATGHRPAAPADPTDETTDQTETTEPTETEPQTGPGTRAGTTGTGKTGTG